MKIFMNLKMKSPTAYEWLVGAWTVLAVYCIGLYYTILEFLWDRFPPSSGSYIQHLKNEIKKSEFRRVSTARSRPIAVVTGASGTIGLEIVRLLLDVGYAVEALTEEKGVLKTLDDNRLSVHIVDMADLTEVKLVTSEIVRDAPDGVDLVVCCAGVMLHPYQVNSLGHEHHMAVNVISHALLVQILLDSTTNADHPVRVVFVSSSTAHAASLDDKILDKGDVFSEYVNGYYAYARSKLALALYAEQLNRHVEDAMHRRGAGDADARIVKMCSVHPGCVAGHLYTNVLFPFRFLINRILAPFMSTFRFPFTTVNSDFGSKTAVSENEYGTMPLEGKQKSPCVAAAEVLATVLNDGLVGGAYYERLRPVRLRPDIADSVRTKLFVRIQSIIRSLSA